MLAVNDLRRDESGNLVRVLHLEPDTDEVIVFPVEAQKGLPTTRQLSVVESYPKQPDTAAAPPSEPPRKPAVEAGARNWAMIEPLVANVGILFADTRGPLIAERAAELRVTEKTVLAKLRAFWRGGLTRGALIPKYASRGKVKAFGEDSLPRGRRPDDERYPIYALKAKDVESIQKSIKKRYLGIDFTTISDAYQRCMEDCYSYRDATGRRVILPAGERPTLRQYRYLLEKLFPKDQITRAKEGKKAFAQNHRGKLGSVMDDCLGVGHIYEIDATIADIYLVSSAPDSRHKIVGKPTLYLIVDRWSRLIVGFHVSLESPSWAAAMQAILSIAEPKEQLCERFGVPYDPADWPADGLYPGVFLADRGELLSYASDSIPGIGTQLKNLPADRPDWKPIVEGNFKQQQVKLADATAGYHPPKNAHKRRGKKYHLDASLTLKEFTYQWIQRIITHNKGPIIAYPLTPTQLANGTRPIPREIWTAEAPRRAASLSRFAYQVVKSALLPRDNFTVTDAGIAIGECLYTSTELETAGWFSRARRKTFKVEVAYDPRLCDTVEVRFPESPTGRVTAHLTPATAHFAGMSFAEVSAYAKMRTRMASDMKDERLQNESDFHDSVDPVTKRAREERKAQSKGKARSARRADTKDERETERRKQRWEEGGMGTAPNNVVPFPTPTAPTAHTEAPATTGATASSTAPAETSPTGASAADGKPLTALQKMLQEKRNRIKDGNWDISSR